MRRVIVGAAMAALIFSGANAGGRDRQEVYEKCDQMGDVAMAVMTARQAGVPIEESLKSAPDSAFGAIVQEMVMWAYQVPDLHSDKMKRDVSEVFRMRVTKDCVKDLLGERD